MALAVVTAPLTAYDTAMMAAETPTQSDSADIPAAAPADPSPCPVPQGEGEIRGAPRRRPAPRVGPYSALRQRLDRRTRLGRRAAAFERALVAQIGGAPSAAEAALIKLAVTLDARIALLRARLLAAGAGDERAERHMISWCNALARTPRTLGLKAAPEPPPSLADIIAESGS
jgi:hypothetical protein